MSLYQIDLTTALRPALQPDESLLFVQDAVGLYSGKQKLPEYQNGQAYLTSHRACYVDDSQPRLYSVAINLKDVESPELYAGFLKSSPKVSLYIKSSQRAPSVSKRSASSGRPGSSSAAPTRLGSPLRTTSSTTQSPRIEATWVCEICSFSNAVPGNFDPTYANATTVLPKCLNCGVQPKLMQLVKAALLAMKKGSSVATAPVPQSQVPLSQNSSQTHDRSSPSAKKQNLVCPRCTFENHASLTHCELCGSSLASVSGFNRDARLDAPARNHSPDVSNDSPTGDDNSSNVIKFSFRGGGEKTFLERLRGALTQRKWLLQNAPPVPTPAVPEDTTTRGARQQVVGIAGLERRGMEMRKNTELVLGNAFEDLEALMTSAKEVIALAESFASQANIGSGPESQEANALLSESANALGLVTTKDMLTRGSNSETLYVSELSRNLAEFLTDDTKGVLKKEGGIMSLVDLWAVFNRVRGGVELISPNDFEKAAQQWDVLKLPVRLRRFKSGLLVVQGRDRTDDRTVAAILAWLKEFHIEEPEDEVPWNWRLYGRGVTAQDTAERFGWSVGVATEELEMAEERGALCREQDIGGLKFWENWLAVANI